MIGEPLDQGFKANMQETATKTPLPIRETPQSISVITEDALEARQVIDIGQALQTAPTPASRWAENYAYALRRPDARRWLDFVDE